MSLNSHQLRKTKQHKAKKISSKIQKQEIILVLDNVLDTYNIGSFFRLADAIGAKKIYLCGPCVTPPNIKIHRASIGTWKFVDWQHFDSTIDCLQQIKKEGYSLVGCELDKNSIDYRQFKPKFPVCLVAGSEVNGLSNDVLKLLDATLELPMFGVNHSLNVLVATSVISYHILAHLKA